MTARRVLAAVAVSALVISACGGDDDSGDAADDAQAALEDIVEGDLAEIAEGIADGDISAEEFVEGLEEAAEDMIDEFNQGGSGELEFQGETIQLEAELCVSFENDFGFAGLGERSDGTIVWFEADQTWETREELLEYFDESMIDTLYGDADPIITQSIQIDYGRTELFGGAEEGQPSLSADNSPGDFGGQGALDMEVSGSSASGSGEAPDYGFALSDQVDELFPFSFSVSCG